jgi:CxxC motif-containing protein (DUF1111 family)
LERSNVLLAKLFKETEALNPELTQGAIIVHTFGTDPAYASGRERLLGLPTPEAYGRTSMLNHGNLQLQLSRRNSTPLFGAGRIDMVPEAVLRQVAAEQSGSGSRVSGRKLGRFGWRGQTDELSTFVAGACSIELGLSVEGFQPVAATRVSVRGTLSAAPPMPQEPDISRRQFADLVEFVDRLPMPHRRTPVDEQEARAAERGEKLFAWTGCAVCHRPNLGDLTGIYSDLLVHDMGGVLADIAAPAATVLGVVPSPSINTNRSSGVYYGTPLPFGERPGERSQEWKTPPLWGVADSAPYLHDGRATTLDEAIRLHGGEAVDVVAEYNELPQRSRDDIGAFLSTLAAPAP